MDIKEFIRGALTAPEEGDTVEYFNLKARVSGNVLTNAQRNIPSPGYTYEADVTKFWEEFQKLKKECGYHLTFNTVMMRVLAEGLKAAPRLNAHLEYNHTASCGRLIVKKHIDVAMPIILESGEDAFDFDDAVTAIFDAPKHVGVSQIENAMAKIESKIKSYSYTPESNIYINYVDAYKGTLESKEIKGIETGTHTIALQRYLRYYK